MKKIGTINRKLSHVIASMGHTDKLVICDCGLPIPDGKEVVDLALTANIPRFTDTLRVVLEELMVEGAVVAGEMESRSNGLYRELREALSGIPIEHVSHEEFKKRSAADGKIIFVRTGEATAYANVMLISGVTF